MLCSTPSGVTIHPFRRTHATCCISDNNGNCYGLFTVWPCHPRCQVHPDRGCQASGSPSPVPGLPYPVTPDAPSRVPGLPSLVLGLLYLVVPDAPSRVPGLPSPVPCRLMVHVVASRSLALDDYTGSTVSGASQG